MRLPHILIALASSSTFYKPLLYTYFPLTLLLAISFASPVSSPHTLSPRSTSYHDPETGFTFSETHAAATLTSNIIYRIAQPANIPSNTPYDIVLQVVAPTSLGWVGLAWGSSMVKNPLTVAYPNGGKGATVSSRWATYVFLLSSLFATTTNTKLKASSSKSRNGTRYKLINITQVPIQRPRPTPPQHSPPSAQATSQTPHTGNTPSNAAAAHPTPVRLDP